MLGSPPRGVVRFRQWATAVRPYIPWREIYLAPEEEQAHYYAWFGVCMSFEWSSSNMLCASYSELASIARPHSARTAQDLLCRVRCRGVVPLTHARQSGAVFGVVPSPRIVKRQEKGAAGVVESDRKRLEAQSPSSSFTLHTAPGLEGAQALCGACEHVSRYLTGMCHVGTATCTPNIHVPVHALARQPRSTKEYAK